MSKKTVNKTVNNDTKIVVTEVTNNQFKSISHFAAKQFTPAALLDWWQDRGRRARLDNVPISKHPFGPEKNLANFGKLSLEAWRTGWKGAL